MPATSGTRFPRSHEGKAEYNEDVRSRLGSGSDDWKVTIAFYEAIHWIEAYLKAKHPGLRTRLNHDQRSQDVQAYLPYLYKSYLGLRKASERFRYQVRYAEEIDVVTAEAHVNRIRDYIRDELSS